MKFNELCNTIGGSLIDYHLYPDAVLYREIKAKKVVFVDFFDTICFRSIHDTQVLIQWAKVMCARVHDIKLTPAELLVIRKKIESELSKKYEEVPYREIISEIFDILSLKSCTKEDFVDLSLGIDIAVELGCQFRNEKVIRILQRAHQEGKSVYVVSDFYLPLKAFECFIRNFALQNIIDGIYVSETVNKTKRKGGSLYGFVLNELKLNAKDVVMIGDNLHSDHKMAQINGVDSLRLFPFWHKVGTNIFKYCKRDFSKKLYQGNIRICMTEPIMQNTFYSYIPIL